MMEFGTLTADSYVLQGGLDDGTPSRNLRKYIGTLASGVRADGACVAVSL